VEVHPATQRFLQGVRTRFYHKKRERILQKIYHGKKLMSEQRVRVRRSDKKCPQQIKKYQLKQKISEI
jgi:hypothetical protein